jgi:RNA polymerase sigma-70 factor (ECF subfamily)
MKATTSPGTCPGACLEAFQRELDYIFASLRRLGVPLADREDVAQEIFLALRASWSKFERDRRLRPYLFAITFRVASAYRRKHGRHVHFELSDVFDGAPGPDEVLEAVQTRGILHAALKRVPLARRAVLIMHYIDDVSVADIARVLSIPLFTAYSRLRIGRRELEAAVARTETSIIPIRSAHGPLTVQA